MSQPVLIQTGSYSIMFDAAVHESHQATATVTQHQIENGPDIADHIRAMPRTISLECMVTNTPVSMPTTNTGGVSGFVGQATATAQQTVQTGIPFSLPLVQAVDFNYPALIFTGEFDRVKDVYTNIVNASMQGFLWNITTTLASYENFALTRLSAPRSAQYGNAVLFDMDFQEVRIVTVDTVTPLPSQQTKPSDKQKPKSRGNQPTQPIDNNAQQKQAVSILSSLAG